MRVTSIYARSPSPSSSSSSAQTPPHSLTRNERWGIAKYCGSYGGECANDGTERRVKCCVEACLRDDRRHCRHCSRQWPLLQTSASMASASSGAAEHTSCDSSTRRRSRSPRGSMESTTTIRELAGNSIYFPNRSFRQGGFADVPIVVKRHAITLLRIRCSLLMRKETVELSLACHESLTKQIQALGVLPHESFHDIINQAWNIDGLDRSERRWLHDLRMQSNKARHIFQS